MQAELLHLLCLLITGQIDAVWWFNGSWAQVIWVAL